MARLNIAVETSSLGLPLRQSLMMAADWGVDAVDLSARGEITPPFSQTGIRELKKLLGDLRLRVSGVTFYSRRGYGTTAELDRRVAATKAAMDLAFKLGARVVVNHVGRVPSDDTSDTWRLMVDVLTDLAHYGNRAGALLAAETGTESGAELARLLDKLPEGLIGAALNPGKLLLDGHSPLEAVTALGQRVLHVYATDADIVPGGRGETTSLGRGASDFPALLGALEDWEYRGYFSVSPQTAADPRQEAADAVAYLRRL